MDGFQGGWCADCTLKLVTNWLSGIGFCGNCRNKWDDADRKRADKLHNEIRESDIAHWMQVMNWGRDKSAIKVDELHKDALEFMVG